MLADPYKTNWSDLSRLLGGTPRQRSAAAVLLGSGLLRRLAIIDPVLCGTIPLDVDLPGSDLDLVCYSPCLTTAEALLQRLSDEYGGSIKQKKLGREESLIYRMTLRTWPVEIVVQTIPVHLQRAFGHMVAEARLLFQGGEQDRRQIRLLKLQGVSTEEAFARHYGLPGDPWETLMQHYFSNFPVLAHGGRQAYRETG